MSAVKTVEAERREPRRLRSTELLGVRIDAVTEAESVTHVVDAIHDHHGGWIVTPNLDHIRRLADSPELRELYRTADLSVADGMPLVWACRIRGTPIPERVAGSNLILRLSAAAADAGLSVYLLGGDPGAAEEAAASLVERYPGLRVAGLHCPPMGFERDPGLLDEVRARVVDAHPDIVFVALGSPKQERLIVELRQELPEAWWIGIGISFSFVCGRVHRAPRWMQRCGLEWVHRLAQEPRRLARRYLVDGLPFCARLFWRCARERLRR